MNGQSLLGESGVYAPRKIVGRARSQSENLKLAQEMAEFARRAPHESRIRIQGDFYTIRKTVGQSRPR
jgi:hypothetical protein